MSFGLGPTGFKRARYNDLVTQMRNSATDLLGENVRVEPPAFIGIVISIFAWFLAQLWAVAEIVYNSAFADTAEGINLDKVAKYIGIRRRPAEPAKGKIKITGDDGATIEAGFRVATEDGIEFTTTETVTIDGEEVEVEIEAVVAGSQGNVPAETITEIVNPVEGASEVVNEEETKDGRDRETDPEFRDRYYRSVARGGASTPEAIEATLLDEDKLEGVRDAVVRENVEKEEVDGIPGKSVNALVWGGDENDIAKIIMETKAAGIKAFGDVEVEVEDSRGKEHQIGFDRPTEKDIYVEADIVTDGDFPTDGKDKVRTEIIKYIGGIDEDLTEYDGLGLNQNVIYTKLIKAIHKVEGITDIPELKIGTSDPPDSENNIIIDDDEVAVTDYEKVVIDLA